jgi:hypothetical protein
MRAIEPWTEFMRDYDDDPDDWDELPEFPASVRTAGVLWVVFGVLGLVTLVVSFALAAGLVAAGGRTDPPGGLGAIIPVFFLIAGIQTVSGTLTGVVFYGVGSIIFGCLYLGVGALILVFSLAPAADIRIPPVALLAIGGVVFALGAMLVVAGILALTGNGAYKRWRRSLIRRRVAREDEEEREYDRRRERRYEEDDRPRRRNEDEEDDRIQRR